MFDRVLETYEHQMQLVELCSVFTPGAPDMQNAGNFIWRPKQQHRKLQTGWDMTGLETDIIEENYPAVLGTPVNDIWEQRADDHRDEAF